MATGEQIASLFTSLGFKVDMKGIRQFEKKMTDMEKRMNNLGKAQRSALSGGKGGGATQAIGRQSKAVETLTSKYDKYEGSLMRIRRDIAKVNDLSKQGVISDHRRAKMIMQMKQAYDRLKYSTDQATQSERRYQSTRGRGRPGKLGERVRGGMSGFVPGFGGGFAAVQSVQAYQNAIGMQQGLTAATGSTEQAQQEFEFLQKEADRLGLFIGNLGKSFTGMAAAARGSSLEGQGVRDIFSGISEQARVLNLSASDTEGVFRAVTQMMNKGQVMAEELKNQLGERMPGAIQATARSLNMLRKDGTADTEALFDAMERGELMAEDVLPKLAAEMSRMARTGGALGDSMENTSASINRFRSALWTANRTFNEAGFDEAVGSLFDRMSTAIAEAEPLWELLGRSATFVGNALEAPIELFGKLSEKLGFFTDEGFQVSDNIKRIGAMLTILLKPLRRIAFYFGILPAAISFISDVLENGFSDKGLLEVSAGLGAIVLAAGMAIAKLRRMAGFLSTISGLRRGGMLGGPKAGGPRSTPGQKSGGSGVSRMSRIGSGLAGAAALGSRAGWVGIAGMTAFEILDMLGVTDAIGESVGNFVESNQSPYYSRNPQAMLMGRNMPMAMGMMRERLARLDGDINFNITSDNPEEVADTVNRELDSIFRGASVINPQIEQ